MPSLYLIRHGKTQWTETKRFAGWANAQLSEKGINEAHIAAKALKASGQSFDMCFTSCLERAKHTAEIIRAEMDMAPDHIQLNGD